jgi:hypothetical protein
MSRLARLVSALWFGSGAFLLLVAPAVFGAAKDPTIAANVVGAMLTRWHYIAVLGPLVLIAFEWRRARAVMLCILFGAIILAASQALLDLRIRAIRSESRVPISALATDDPVRRHFGMLHGISSLLLIGQVLAAAVVVSLRPE